MSAFSELGNEALRSMQSALSAFGYAFKAGATGTVRAVSELGQESKRCITGTVRISYNGLGQATFPIEQEVTHTNLPEASEISVAGWILCFPFEIAAIAASLTVFPFVGNSLQVLPRAIRSAANLGYIDYPIEQQFQQSLYNDNRNFLRKLYGIPGYFGGGLIGLGVAGIVVSGRTITNSCKSLVDGWKIVSNHSMTKDPRFVREGEPNNDNVAVRTSFSHFLGIPGFVIGFSVGSLFSFTYNNIYSFGRGFASGLRIGFDRNDAFDVGEDQRRTAGKVLGSLGYSTGLALGLVSTSLVIAARIMTNSFKSAVMGFNLVTDYVNHVVRAEGEAQDPNLSRTWFSQLLGLPGLILGMSTGLLAVIISNFCKSFRTGFLHLANLVIDARDQEAIGNDERSMLQKTVGVPGLITGGIVGLFCIPVILLGRLVSNSLKSFINTTQITEKFFENGNQAVNPIFINRGVFSQMLGLPGLAFGFTFGCLYAFISHSLKSFGYGFINSFTRFGLDLQFQFNDERTNAAKRIGSIGYVIGWTTGIAASAALMLIRMIPNSFTSFSYASQKIKNYFYQPQANLEDARSLQQKILGLPGLLLGATYRLLKVFISESLNSAGYRFIKTVDFALDTRDEFQLQDLRNLRTKIIGGLGNIPGFALALPVAGLALLGRVVTNTFKSFVSGYKAADNFFDPKENANEQPSQRSWLSLILGFPGLILGSFFATVAALIVNTGISFGYGFNQVKSAAFNINPDVLRDERTRSSKALGSLGWLLGAGLGLITGTSYGIYITLRNNTAVFKRSYNDALSYFENIPNNREERQLNSLQKILSVPSLIFGYLSGSFVAFLRNNLRSFMQGLTFLVNPILILDHSNPIAISADNRTSLGKIAGGIGLITGLITGLIADSIMMVGQIIRNSFVSLGLGYKATTRFFNKSPGEAQQQVQQEEQPTRPLLYAILGVGGYGLGITLGSVTSFIKHSFISLVQGLVYGFGLGLDADDRLGMIDNRNYYAKALGSLGWIAGAGIGCIFAIGALGLRIITNSVRSFFSTFIKVHAFFNNGNYINRAKNPRSYFSHALGSPGFLLGGISATAFALFYHTGESFQRAFQLGVNLGLDSNDAYNVNNDERKTSAKIIGGIGFGLGYGLGFVSSVFVLAARVITNSFKSFCSRYTAITGFFNKLANAAPDPQNNSNRSIPSLILGIPGEILGFTFGCISAFTKHSCLSLARGFLYSFNFGLDARDRFNQPDNRNKFAKGLGVLGCAIGASLGSLAAIVSLGARIVTNSFKSIVSGFKAVTYYFNPLAGNIPPAAERSLLSKTLGIPGLFIGFGLGLSFAFFRNSIQSIGSGFVDTLNYLDIGRQSNYQLADNRNTAAKYLGGIGYAFGMITGSIASLALNMMRLLNHSWFSFVALTGHCLNTALEVNWMGGLANDNRSDTHKKVGVLGYVLASPLVPLSFFTYVFRKTVPILTFFALGVAASPLVFAGKYLARLFASDNFTPPQGELEIKNENDVMQGFRNVYSSLTFYGKFKPGAISANAKGNESVGTFIRKTLTFNMKTVTERTLHTLLTRYKEQAAGDEGGYGIHFFSDDNVARIQRELKTYYRDSSLFNTVDEINEIETEIDNVVNFVKDYIIGHVNNNAVDVPANLYPPGGPSWGAAFFQPRIVAPAAVQNLALRPAM